MAPKANAETIVLEDAEEASTALAVAPSTPKTKPPSSPSALNASPKQTATPKKTGTTKKPSGKLASPKAKAKTKAKAKAKATAVKSKSTPKKRPSKNEEKEETGEKDQKKAKTGDPDGKNEESKKVPKESMAKQAAGWAKALDEGVEEKEKAGDDDEQLEEEPRDRQKAQKYAKLLKGGGLPKEVAEAMEAADKSANPRAAKTQLINRLFKKDGNKFVMVPNDPSFQRVQKFLDTKFGKEQANSHFDAFFE